MVTILIIQPKSVRSNILGLQIFKNNTRYRGEKKVGIFSFTNNHTFDTYND